VNEGELPHICALAIGVVFPTLGVSFSFASLPLSALKTPVECSGQAGSRKELFDSSEPDWTREQSFYCRNTLNTQVSKSFFHPEERVWGNSPICNGLSACDTQIRIFIPSFDLVLGSAFICDKAAGIIISQALSSQLVIHWIGSVSQFSLMFGNSGSWHEWVFNPRGG